MTLREGLERYWGFAELRPLQAEVVEAALNGRDAIVVLPTGGGKSLCYQLPPVMDGRLTVVVSPLIALMKDQNDALRLSGYPSAALNSHQTAAERLEIARRVKQGEVKLLYLSPERIVTESCAQLLAEADRGRGPARFAIDEAHCISHWGHDFRPEYRELARVRAKFSDAPFHALTATATPRVQEDIGAQLGLRDPAKFVGVFDRPNLTYRIVPKVDRLHQIAKVVGRYEGEASIVYCISRKDTEELSSGLTRLGVPAVAYHAGLDNETRRRVSEDFAQERANVVVATVAFGMGIDRSNVRCVVHESMPRSIEAYQQETGRAGRDGLPSECTMLYSPSDVVRWDRLLSESPREFYEHQAAQLDEVRKFAVGTECRHKFLSAYFGQRIESENCGACDLCIEGWEAAPGSTRIAHKVLATVMDLQRKHGDFYFGARHIASVLTGSRAKQVLKHGHESLRGHNSLAMSIARAQSFVEQLVDKGMLRRVGGLFPGVALTQLGLDTFLGRSEVALRDVVPEDVPARRYSGPVGDRALFDDLRALRREIASERRVPVDAVLSDVAVINISKQRPLSLQRLGEVAGVGTFKADDLGPRIIDVVRRHTNTRPRGNSAKTAERLAPHFSAGRRLSEIARLEGLAESTIGQYLGRWIEETRPECVSAWVDEDSYRRAASAFEEMGVTRLAPIFEALGGEVSYESLHVVRAHWSIKNALPDVVKESDLAYC